MDTNRLLSPKLKQAAEALKVPLEIESQVDESKQLEEHEMREKAQDVSQRLKKLIWHDPRNLDGKTLPLDWKEPISRSGSNGTRSVDASPWIDIDAHGDGRVVQAQLQTWRDQLDVYGEHGGRLDFSSAEQRPIPSISLRVRSSDGQSATESEEIFRLTAPESVLFRGERMSPNADRWSQLDQLVLDIETWRSK